MLCSNPSATPKMVELLLKTGKNINEKYFNGNTSLHNIFRNQKIDLDILNLFLKYKAHLNIPNRVYEYPIHIACSNEHISSEILLFLIENKCDLNSKNAYSFSPLHLLSKNQNSSIDCFKVLLENNSDVNLECDYNSTPLNQLFLQKNQNFLDKALLLLCYGSTTRFNITHSSILFQNFSQYISDAKEGVLWRFSLHDFYPLNTQKIVFTLLLTIKFFSRSIHQVFPKPLFVSLVQQITTYDIHKKKTKKRKKIY